MPIRAAHQDPRSSTTTAYRRRTVDAGVRATFIVVLALAVYPWLPGTAVVELGWYLALVGVASAGAVLVALLPWERMFAAGWGARGLYAWSILDILIIAAVVAVSGGGASPLAFLFIMTTVFSAASYPLRGQAGVLGITFLGYGAANWATGGTASPATLVYLPALLLAVAYLANFLSRELFAESQGHADARAQSERRAAVLSEVAQATRELNALEPEVVLDAGVQAVVRLGFTGASLNLVEPDGTAYRVVRAIGLPDGYGTDVVPAQVGITGEVLAQRRTVIVDAYSARPSTPGPMRAAGFRSVVGAPVWAGERLVGALIAGVQDRRAIPREEIEALELLAAQTGLALDNARLFEEQRRAAARLGDLDRLKTQFLRSISHELRTPVSVVAGMARTLDKRWQELTDEDRQSLVVGIDDSARRLQEAIVTLLDFLSVGTTERGGTPDRPLVPTPLMGLFEGVLGAVGHLFARHDLQVEIPPGLSVRADAPLLGKALQQLLTNAVRYTPAGTTVRLTARRAGDRVEVAVSDDGPGIAAEDLPRVGERFYRGGDDNSRPSGGLGLGLALATEILAAHGSRLEVSSVEGQGTKFAFSLPAAIAAVS